MANKFHSDLADAIEVITYRPKVQDTADLEASTNAITATSEASGLGSADYSAALTLPAPGDERVAVLKIAARLAVTIDSMTAGTLFCRVYVDVQDADHRLFDLSWSGTGQKLSPTFVDAVIKATVFNLLKDGLAHTFYFYFWVDSGNAVLSEVRLWEIVGTVNTASSGHPDGDVLSLTHTGEFHIGAYLRVVGTSSACEMRFWLQQDDWESELIGVSVTGASDYAGYANIPPMFLNGTGVLRFKQNVSTDIVGIGGIMVTLRSFR